MAAAPAPNSPASSEPAIPAHPTLKEPILSFKGPLASVPDAAIVDILHECLRLRLKADEVESDSSFAERTGHIEFEHLMSAERAYATVKSYPIPGHDCTLQLSIPGSSDVPPSSRIRIVKQLPDDTTPGKLFDLFRPFGPLFKVVLQYAPTPSGPTFRGLGLVEFYDEQHASQAERELHCSDYEGQTITIQVYEPKRGPISGLGVPTNFQQRSVSTGSYSNNANQGSTPHRSFSGPHQPHNGSLSPIAGGAMVDRSNLHIKNLDPSLTSSDLFHAFRHFGHIVSAHVMRNEQTKQSKEFGFVSFSDPNDAAKALGAMNGSTVTGKSGVSCTITVAYHEPKRFRESRLAKSHNTSSPDSSIDEVAAGVSNLLTNSVARHASISSTTSSSSNTGIDQSQSERDRLFAGVQRIAALSSKADEITDLLFSLPKKDRALCLFNPEVLRTKAFEANEIVEVTGTEDTNITTSTPQKAASITANDTTTTTTATLSESPTSDIPTLESISQLSAVEIIKLASSTNRPDILAEPNKSTIDEMDAFIDSLADKSVNEQKQKLGDKLFKVIKGLGIKGAPHITIRLLDTEDLRALAHLMAEQPSILAEKAKRVPPKPVTVTPTKKPSQ